jgi:Ca-activated chloride channel homolog
MSERSGGMRAKWLNVVLLCSLGFVCDKAVGQSDASPAVFVAAVKGECEGGGAFFVVNGKVIAMPTRPVMNSPQVRVSLTRFDEDPSTQKETIAAFRKSTALRVVDTPAEADFVFCVCSGYFSSPPGMRQQMPLPPPTRRVEARAVAVSVPTFRRSAADFRELLRAAVWTADTTGARLEDGKGKQGDKDDQKKDRKKSDSQRQGPRSVVVINGVEVDLDQMKGTGEPSPAELVERFLQESRQLIPALTAKARAAEPEAAPAETKRPTIVTGRDTNTTQPAEPVTTTDDDTIRIETSLVVVPISATDKDGRYVPGLTKDDFQLSEEGVAQEVSDFGGVESPIHAVLLLDTSGSTRFKLEEIQEAALAFIDQLRPQDRVMVISFDDKVWIDAEFTNDREKLLRAILRTRTGGNTRLYDALDLSLTERLSRVQGRKAVVVFTDGMDSRSRLAGVKDVLEHVEESGTLVYPVRYDTFTDMTNPATGQAPPGARLGQMLSYMKSDYERAAEFLKKLAAQSGGRYYAVETIKDTRQAFASIAEELRRQYWLGYYPANPARDGSYRRIRVRVSKPGVAIRARDGYRAGGEPKPNAAAPAKQPAVKQPGR